jgi:muramoyltetrapeptide carboxypeptidase
MITPTFLREGDAIGIVATARKVGEAEIAPAVKLLESWGYRVIPGQDLFREDRQFAGTDEERAADMQRMLDNPEIKAIMIARGGYGTMRIIDMLDFIGFDAHPKWIIGFSDVTVFHSHIHTNHNTETIHANMCLQLGKSPEADDSLRKALAGELLGYELGGSYELNRPGTGSGQLVGGNLSLLYALNNSASDIDTDGKILFIEDLDEYLYHVDRMILSLKRAGKLEKLAGLIVGGMTEMKDNQVPFGRTAEEIIIDAVQEYHYPVCFHFPAGHIERNLPLIMGRVSRLDVAAGGVRLSF